MKKRIIASSSILLLLVALGFPQVLAVEHAADDTFTITKEEALATLSTSFDPPWQYWALLNFISTASNFEQLIKDQDIAHAVVFNYHGSGTWLGEKQGSFTDVINFRRYLRAFRHNDPLYFTIPQLRTSICKAWDEHPEWEINYFDEKGPFVPLTDIDTMHAAWKESPGVVNFGPNRFRFYNIPHPSPRIEWVDFILGVIEKCDHFERIAKSITTQKAIAREFTTSLSEGQFASLVEVFDRHDDLFKDNIFLKHSVNKAHKEGWKTPLPEWAKIHLDVEKDNDQALREVKTIAEFEYVLDEIGEQYFGGVIDLVPQEGNTHGTTIKVGTVPVKTRLLIADAFIRLAADTKSHNELINSVSLVRSKRLNHNPLSRDDFRMYNTDSKSFVKHSSDADLHHDMASHHLHEAVYVSAARNRGAVIPIWARNEYAQPTISSRVKTFEYAAEDNGAIGLNPYRFEYIVYSMELNYQKLSEIDKGIVDKRYLRPYFVSVGEAFKRIAKDEERYDTLIDIVGRRTSLHNSNVKRAIHHVLRANPEWGPAPKWAAAAVEKPEDIVWTLVQSPQELDEELTLIETASDLEALLADEQSKENIAAAVARSITGEDGEGTKEEFDASLQVFENHNPLFKDSDPLKRTLARSKMQIKDQNVQIPQWARVPLDTPQQIRALLAYDPDVPLYSQSARLDSDLYVIEASPNADLIITDIATQESIALFVKTMMAKTSNMPDSASQDSQDSADERVVDKGTPLRWTVELFDNHDPRFKQNKLLHDVLKEESSNQGVPFNWEDPQLGEQTVDPPTITGSFFNSPTAIIVVIILIVFIVLASRYAIKKRKEVGQSMKEYERRLHNILGSGIKSVGTKGQLITFKKALVKIHNDDSVIPDQPTKTLLLAIVRDGNIRQAAYQAQKTIEDRVHGVTKTMLTSLANHPYESLPHLNAQLANVCQRMVGCLKRFKHGEIVAINIGHKRRDHITRRYKFYEAHLHAHPHLKRHIEKAAKRVTDEEELHTRILTVIEREMPQLVAFMNTLHTANEILTKEADIFEAGKWSVERSNKLSVISAPQAFQRVKQSFHDLVRSDEFRKRLGKIATAHDTTKEDRQEEEEAQKDADEVYPPLERQLTVLDRCNKIIDEQAKEISDGITGDDTHIAQVKKLISLIDLMHGYATVVLWNPYFFVAKQAEFQEGGQFDTDKLRQNWESVYAKREEVGLIWMHGETTPRVISPDEYPTDIDNKNTIRDEGHLLHGKKVRKESYSGERKRAEQKLHSAVESIKLRYSQAARKLTKVDMKHNSEYFRGFFRDEDKDKGHRLMKDVDVYDFLTNSNDTREKHFKSLMP